jgi:hypothetical protein
MKQYTRFFEKVMSYGDAVKFIKDLDPSFPDNDLSKDTITTYRRKLD